MKLVPAASVMLALSLPAAGATVRVHVHRGTFTGPIELEISPVREDRPFQPVASQTLAANAGDAGFNALPAGAAAVPAARSHPLPGAAAQRAVGAAATRYVGCTHSPRRLA